MEAYRQSDKEDTYYGYIFYTPRVEIPYKEPEVNNKGDFVEEHPSYGKLLESARNCNNILVSMEGNESTYTEKDVPSEADFRGGSYESGNGKVNEMSEKNKDHIRYRKLLKAIKENDWKGVEDFITKNPEALTAKNEVNVEENIFHKITRKLDAPFWLMDRLAPMAAPESLEQLKESTIFWAAAFGNKKAAEAFERMNSKLPNTPNSQDLLPIHEAAASGHKEIVQYLWQVTTVPLDDQKGVTMLIDLIGSGLYGIAFSISKQYLNLGRERNEDRSRILQMLANKPKAFASGSQFGYWRRFIYHCTPMHEDDIPSPTMYEDEEDAIDRSNELKKSTLLGSLLRQIYTPFVTATKTLHVMLWNVLMQLVPSIKGIYDTKLTHMQTLDMVRMICHERGPWDHKEAVDTLLEPMLTAAKLGIYELVQEILNAYFYSYTFAYEDGHSIFHLAILHRQERVFSLINKMNFLIRDWKAAPDMKKFDDNILHLAGKLVRSSQVPGAALQMQRELQWFKAVESYDNPRFCAQESDLLLLIPILITFYLQAVESYVHPSLQEQRNNSNKTPREVFTEEHKDLVKEGEKWMKDTASSCTVVAALIITVVFAASFTVPGGNNDKGMPHFLHAPSFIVFVISDALSLFTSSTSLLMFLGILTSRYAEQDFLKSLPNKLIFGLITLFFSIASMMVAFGSAIYIVFSQSWKWTIFPISLLGCFPVTLFSLLEFPLLVEIFLSTYRPSISSL